ncbi:uncharacterized protein LOC134083301 [Sardina pilchardus]|uniref:uncharacterized protein LOC134083301 n=1 Tax=Sardina pilchardus TaxID=27697 RepID=UPI002E148102
MEGQQRDDSVNELDLHASIKQHVQGSCDICLDGIHGAVRYCHACSASFCERHLTDHSRAPTTSAHVLAHPSRTSRAASATAPPPAAAPENAGVSWTWLVAMVLVALVAVMIPNYVNRDDAQPLPGVLMPESEAEASELRACCRRVHLSAEEQKRSMTELMCQLQSRVQEKRRALHAHVRQQQRHVAEHQPVLDEGAETYRDLVMEVVEQSYKATLSHLDSIERNIRGDLDWCSELPSALELPGSSYAA